MCLRILPWLDCTVLNKVSVFLSSYITIFLLVMTTEKYVNGLIDILKYINNLDCFTLFPEFMMGSSIRNYELVEILFSSTLLFVNFPNEKPFAK